MEFKSGMWVQNPKQPAWGIGQVLGCEENKVRVLFSEGGEKLLDLQFMPAGPSFCRRVGGEEFLENQNAGL